MKKKVYVTLLAVMVFILVLGGTTLAYAKTGFGMSGREGAVISTIETISSFEERVIQNAVQLMRTDEVLKYLAVVETPTNDMAAFPSAKNPLYPDYVSRRYSRFEYTIDSYGLVAAHTDGEANKLLQWIDKVLQTLQTLGSE